MQSAEVTSQEILQNPLPEYEYKGSTDVFAAMHVKQQLLKEMRLTEAAKIRIGIIGDGGGQAVSNETGAIEDLFQRGMFDGVVDVLVGASGGSVVVTNGVVGNTRAKQIFQENCENMFFAFQNLLKPFRERKVADGSVPAFRRAGHGVREFIHALGEPKGIVNLTGYRKALDTHSVTLSDLQHVKPDVYAYVVNADTSEQELVDLKSLDSDEQLNDALFASCCMPFIGDAKIAEMRGNHYIDGSVRKINIADVMDRFGLTHVLVLRSHPVESDPKEERIATIFDKLSHLPGVRTDIPTREGCRAFRQGLDSMPHAYSLLWTRPDIKLGIFAPKKATVGTLCMDYQKISAAMKGSAYAMHQLLDEHQQFEQSYEQVSA